MEANTSIDSLRSVLVDEAKKAYEINDPDFVFTRKLIFELTEDSLILLLNGIPPDEYKAFTLSYIVYHSVMKEEKLPVLQMEEALQIAEQIDKPKLWYWVYRSLAFYKKAKGDYKDAIRYFKISDEYAIKINYPLGRIRNIVHIAETYTDLKNYEKAFEYAFENLRVREGLKQNFGLGFAYYYLGELYLKIEDYSEAYSYYSKAETVYRNINHRDYTGRMLSYKANVRISQNLLDTALIYSENAIKIFREIKSDPFLGEGFMVKGEIFDLKKNYDRALNYYHLADSLLGNKNQLISVQQALNTRIGKIYQSLKNYELAEKYYNINLEASKAYNNPLTLSSSYNNLAKLQFEKGDYKLASELALLAIHNAQKFNQNHEELTGHQILFDALFHLNEYEKAFITQKEIAILSNKIQEELQNKNIANLKLSFRLKEQRDEAEKAQMLATHEEKWSKRFALFITIGFSVIFLLLIQILRSSRKRTKVLSIKNNEIALLNESLESKVKERTKALEEKSILLNNYFDNLPGVAYQARCEETFAPFFISKGSYDLLGKSPGELINSHQSIRMLIHPDYRNEIIQKANAFNERNDPDEILEQIYPVEIDGNLRWILDRSKIVIDSTGNKHSEGILLNLTETVNTRQALLNSQKDLSLIYDNTQDFMGLVQVGENGDLTFESLNQPCLRFLVENEMIKEGQDLIGMKMIDFWKNILKLTDKMIDEHVHYYNLALSSRKRVSFEDVVVKSNQEKKYSDVTLTPVIDESSGLCKRIIFVVHDISERVRAEQAFLKSQNEVSLIYNNTQDILGLVEVKENGDMFLESVNQPCIDFFIDIGWQGSNGDLIGMKMVDFWRNILKMTEPVIAELQNYYDTARLSKERVIFEDIVKIDNQIKRISEITLTPVIDESSGLCNRIIFVVHEITERVKAEKALIQSKNRLNSVFNGTKEMMAIIDVSINGELIVEKTNKSFKDSWEKINSQIELNSILGKSLEHLHGTIKGFPKSFFKENLQQYQNVAKNKRSISFEELYIDQNNKKYFLDVTVSPLLNNENQCTKLLFVLRDITLKHHAKEQMISKILETEDRERKRIAKELHDSIGQNLTAASLNFNYVNKRMDQKNADIRNKLELGISFLSEAIDESRNIAHNLMPQAIADFGYVLSIESLLENLNQTTDIEFTFYDNLKNQRLPSDIELSLYRITQEAINNAIKHAQATEIVIQLMKHPDSLILSIEDNGSGFKTNQKIKGFGLNGMKNRVSALSGILDIDTFPDKGTVITVEIPILVKNKVLSEL